VECVPSSINAARSLNCPYLYRFSFELFDCLERSMNERQCQNLNLSLSKDSSDMPFTLLLTRMQMIAYSHNTDFTFRLANNSP